MGLPAAPATLPCLVCGTPVVPNPIGQARRGNSVLCGPTCRAIRRREAKRVFNRARYRPNGGAFGPQERRCLRCARRFETVRTAADWGAAFCSDGCRERYTWDVAERIVRALSPYHD